MVSLPLYPGSDSLPHHAPFRQAPSEPLWEALNWKTALYQKLEQIQFSSTLHPYFWWRAPIVCSRRESNPDLRFRKPSFYPLNYGSNCSTDAVNCRNAFLHFPQRSASLVSALEIHVDPRHLLPLLILPPLAGYLFTRLLPILSKHRHGSWCRAWRRVIRLHSFIF